MCTRQKTRNNWPGHRTEWPCSPLALSCHHQQSPSIGGHLRLQPGNIAAEFIRSRACASQLLGGAIRLTESKRVIRETAACDATRLRRRADGQRKNKKHVAQAMPPSLTLSHIVHCIYPAQACYIQTARKKMKTTTVGREHSVSRNPPPFLCRLIRRRDRRTCYIF